MGLSGGVDSSVAALLLKQQGYEVIGVYMKNWSRDLPGVKCPWEEDYQDAKRIAVQLDIEFRVYDFEKEYKHKVVDYMIREYKAGRTPNPDVICNQEVKFKLFLETALEDGADYIATGHYAKVRGGKLLRAKDENKDQTYFLYRISPKALSKVLFPLADLRKKEVREIAAKNGLISANRKESMGICFVGKVGIKDFLSQYVAEKSGNIIDQSGKIVGRHEGAIFYTIGQRQGLNIGGGLPYYVTGKNMKKNEVYVTTDLQDEKLWSKEVRLTDMHWINKTSVERSNLSPVTSSLSVRTRHRAPLIPVEILNMLSISEGEARLKDEVRALTPGQSAVFYSGDRVLGGGIVV